MTPEQTLRHLRAIREEVQQRASERFRLGIGVPYTKELKELDEQIAHFEKQVPPPLIANGMLVDLVNSAHYKNIDSVSTTDNFKVSIKDREIWINSYLLSKPHATGKNMSFFEYLFENNGQHIEREMMPEYLKKDVSGKTFPKIINALGFKGEILKAFFPKRGKNDVMFRKEVTALELNQNRVNIEKLTNELEVAHSKNNPI
ncbi:MAG: hypothetical protein WAX85_01260 [Minisyncoccia bacterium]